MAIGNVLGYRCMICTPAPALAGFQSVRWTTFADTGTTATPDDVRNRRGLAIAPSLRVTTRTWIASVEPGGNIKEGYSSTEARAGIQ